MDEHAAPLWPEDDLDDWLAQLGVDQNQSHHVEAPSLALPSDEAMLSEFLTAHGFDSAPGQSESDDAKPKPSRLRWTPELHALFTRCVNELGGLESATPKALLQLMQVPGMTMLHLKSHLQKYRQQLPARGKGAEKGGGARERAKESNAGNRDSGIGNAEKKGNGGGRASRSLSGGSAEFTLPLAGSAKAAANNAETVSLIGKHLRDLESEGAYVTVTANASGMSVSVTGNRNTSARARKGGPARPSPRSGSKGASNPSVQIEKALQMQLDMQERLRLHMEQQRRLQQAIEENRKYLKRVMDDEDGVEVMRGGEEE